MKRTGRTLVILTMAAWLAALTPASAAPGPAADDPVRIGIGIGGDIIDVLGHDEGNGDEGNGDENGDENGSGLLDLLLGNGDDDENGDGLLDELVDAVGKVLAAIFGEGDDSVGSPTGMSVASASPSDDDGLVPQLVELLEELELDEIEPVEDVLDLVEDVVEFVVVTIGQNQVVATICQLRRIIATGIVGVAPPIGPTPTCVP